MHSSIAIGFSDAPTPQEAIYQACLSVKNKLGLEECDLLVVLTTPGYASKEIIPVIHALLKPARLVGTSCTGIILPEQICPRGIALLALSKSDLMFGSSVIQADSNDDYRQLGFNLGKQAVTDFGEGHRQAGFILTDNHFAQHPFFLKGLQEVVGAGFPLFGAISSDDMSFKKTAQMHQYQYLTGCATCLLIGNSAGVAIGSSHGFKPLGKPRIVTQTDGYVLRTIDDQPAINLYTEFLGKANVPQNKNILKSPALLYPMGLYIEGTHQYLLKNAVDILQDGSIVCQSEVPLGSEIHLMIANKDALRQSAIEAATDVKNALGGRQAKFIFIIESSARQKILGRAAFTEIEAIKEVLGYTTPLIGFYAFGEISPFSSVDNVKKTFVHNESILIFAVS